MKTIAITEEQREKIVKWLDFLVARFPMSMSVVNFRPEVRDLIAELKT